HNVVVAAPSAQRSGSGHGMTFARPVRVKKVTIEGLQNLPAYAIEGTPADCARIGCTGLDVPVDMVVSGINHGANLGSDVLYSGTVGAAMEGALVGKPAIAVSVYNHQPRDFSAAVHAACWGVQYVEKHPLPQGMILNINAPELPISSIKGIKTAGLCLQSYGGDYTRFQDPFGMWHYWMSIEQKTTTFEKANSNDEYWVQQGYVTVTPIHYDIACYSYMEQMRLDEADFFGCAGAPQGEE
ncbi:5'/3'-nucleotidase SurE, partial [Christensenellaceae bacterium OttesenSCG-928-L17]|nr:5'/3'-nucleotidase SurE [Christensenellaceae bacterium OttesenSCG-928-L17]